MVMVMVMIMVMVSVIVHVFMAGRAAFAVLDFLDGSVVLCAAAGLFV